MGFIIYKVHHPLGCLVCFDNFNYISSEALWFWNKEAMEENFTPREDSNFENTNTEILMSHIMECSKRSYHSFNTFYMY